MKLKLNLEKAGYYILNKIDFPGKVKLIMKTKWKN